MFPQRNECSITLKTREKKFFITINQEHSKPDSEEKREKDVNMTV